MLQWLVSNTVRDRIKYRLFIIGWTAERWQDRSFTSVTTFYCKTPYHVWICWPQLSKYWKFRLPKTKSARWHLRLEMWPAKIMQLESNRGRIPWYLFNARDSHKWVYRRARCPQGRCKKVYLRFAVTPRSANWDPGRASKASGNLKLIDEKSLRESWRFNDKHQKLRCNNKSDDVKNKRKKRRSGLV